MAAEGPYERLTIRTVRTRFVAFMLTTVALVGLSAILLLRHPTYSLRLTACFQNVNGLHRGELVRIAGVDVGTVRSVRAQPTDSTCPADVEMELRTDYPLNIPSDSVAMINTAGLLGSPYVAIDATHASGPVMVKSGQIRSQENPPFTADSLERFVKGLVETITAQRDEKKNAIAAPRTPERAGPPSPKLHSK